MRDRHGGRKGGMKGTDRGERKGRIGREGVRRKEVRQRELAPSLALAASLPFSLLPISLSFSFVLLDPFLPSLSYSLHVYPSLHPSPYLLFLPHLSHPSIPPSVSLSSIPPFLNMSFPEFPPTPSLSLSLSPSLTLYFSPSLSPFLGGAS